MVLRKEPLVQLFLLVFWYMHPSRGGRTMKGHNRRLPGITGPGAISGDPISDNPEVWGASNRWYPFKKEAGRNDFQPDRTA